MARIPSAQTWVQHTSSFPAKDVGSKPAYSSDGTQAPSSVASLPGDIKIKRISDYAWALANVPNFNTYNDEWVGHVYAHQQPFNSDNSKILFNSGNRWRSIYNADGTFHKTLQYAHKHTLWSNTSPVHVFAADTWGSLSSLLRVHIDTEEVEYIIDCGYEVNIGKSEGDISNDDTKIVLSNDNNGNIRLACVDIPNGTKHEILINRSYSEMDWAMVSPLGNYVVVSYNGGDRRLDLYTWAGTLVRRITKQQHSDLGVDQNGDECVVLVGHTEGTTGTSVDKYRLTDNQKTVLCGGDNEFPNTSGQPILDGHVSCSASRWGVPIAHVSSFGSGGPHVVFGVAMDGSGDVYYYGFHNSSVLNYGDQPHFNTDRTGKIGIFRSNWGNTSDHAECYLCWDDSAEVAPEAPVLEDPSDITITGGNSTTFQLVAPDPQGDPVTYSKFGTSASWISCTNTGLVTVSPSTAVASDFTVQFVANDGANNSNVVTVLITVIQADVGTATSFPVIPIDPSGADVVAGTGQTFEESTSVAGYTGGSLLQATAGYNSPHDLTPGVIGYIPVDLTSLPSGSWHMYIRTYATSAGDDSFHVSVNNQNINHDQPIYSANGYSWQPLRDTNDLALERLVSAADMQLKIYPREQGAGIDRIVFVPASETGSPSGTKGFEYVAATGNTAPVLSEPTDVNVNAGQSGSFQLVSSDADGDSLTHSVSGNAPSWISCNGAGVVSYDPSQAISGPHSVDFVATDGQSNSNIVTVVFTVAAYDQYAVQIDLSGGDQSFDMWRTIQSIGVVTQTNYPPDINGHYCYIAGSGNQANQQASTETMINSLISQDAWNDATKQGWRGYRTKKRWDWLDNGSENTHLTTLLNKTDENDSYLFVEIDDVNFGLSSDSSSNKYATVSKSFCPTWIENSGGAAVGGNPSNLSAGGKLWVAWVMDEFIATIKAVHDHCKGHSSYAGVILPETTRSEYTGGGLGNSNNFQNVDSPFYTQYKRMITELKAYMPNHLVIPSPNYMGSFLTTLIDDMDALGGCGISTPDTNQFHDPLNPNASEIIHLFTYMRAKRDEMLIAPSVQTRDADDYPDDAYNMCFDSPYTSDHLNPHIMFWYLSHPDVNDATWAARVKSKLRSVNWHRNTDIPNELANGTTTGGDNADHTNLGYSGSNLLLSPKLGTAITDTDDFTVVFADDPENPVTISVSFYDSDPDGANDSTGTQTGYKSFRFKPTPNDVVSQGVPNWIASQAYTGYSGNFHMITANGANISGNTSCDYIPLDLAAILPPTGLYHLYPRVSAPDSSSDSVWADVDGEGMTQDQPIYGADGTFKYQTFRDTSDVDQERLVSAADGVIKWYPREINAGLDSFVFVEAAETKVPTGTRGFISFVWPGQTTITPPDDEAIVIGQGVIRSFAIAMDSSISAFGIGHAVVDANGDTASTVNITNYNLTTSSGVDYYTIDYVGFSAGECRIQMTFRDGADPSLQMKSEFSVRVIDPATIVWPQGTSATIPSTLEIVQGGGFTIDADPQNISGVALAPNPWAASNTNVSIDSTTEGVATFTAKAIGTCIITYTMERAENPDDPVIYQTVVTVNSPQTINPDDFLVKNNQTAVPLDVLSNDIQTRITSFTQPATGYLYANADQTKLYYNPAFEYIGNLAFSYTADDGEGGDIDSANVTLQVVDPLSFEGSVEVTTGIDRYGVRGSLIPVECLVVSNPENFDIAYLWSHGFGELANFKNGVIDQSTAVLQINSDSISLADVLASVTCEVSQA